jgi:hypothetical protein
MYKLTNYDVINGHGKKFGLFKLFPEFCAKKMLTPKKLLQRAVKYFTARWSLERMVKCYFTARQSREKQACKEETRTSK